MSQTWFVSDEHYNDKNMVGPGGHRPFETQLEMIRAFQRAHNDVVEPNDLVCHLGDYFMASGGLAPGDASKILAELRGHHVLVRGNHDKPDRWTPAPAFKWIRFKTSIDAHDGERDLCCVLDHWPMRTWSRKHYGAVQLHGHEHGNLPPLANQLDVGIDHAHRLFGEWRPFSGTDVLQVIRLQNQMLQPNPDNDYGHHGKLTPVLGNSTGPASSFRGGPDCDAARGPD